MGLRLRPFHQRAPPPISAVNTTPTTYTNRHTEHDLATGPTRNSYMYCQIAPRSTIDPADTPHPIHVYYAVIYVLERVDTEGFKRKVENDRE